jgi:hypothetical protein
MTRGRTRCNERPFERLRTDTHQQVSGNFVGRRRAMLSSHDLEALYHRSGLAQVSILPE